MIAHGTVAHLQLKVTMHLHRVYRTRMSNWALALAFRAVSLLTPLCHATWPTIVAYGSLALAEWTRANGGACHSGADGRTLDEQETDDTTSRRIRGCHVDCWWSTSLFVFLALAHAHSYICDRHPQFVVFFWRVSSLRLARHPRLRPYGWFVGVLRHGFRWWHENRK
jgi:hypothetical protein